MNLRPAPFIIRSAVLSLLLLLPVTSAWNMVSARFFPEMELRIGDGLAGVTLDAPVSWSWPALWDGSLKRWVSNRMRESLPMRPLLIRFDNELRYALFREVSSTLFIGRDGQLIERKYLDDYCARKEGAAAKFATTVIPKLLDIQNYYATRGRVFIYVVTPSKAAYFPNSFSNFQPCPSSTAARETLVPEYMRLLKQAGVHAVDTVALLQTLRLRHDFEMFPNGGIHWNDVAATEVVAEIVREINRQAGRELVPSFKFRFTMNQHPSGVDRDLADLLNVLYPPLDYVTPKVAFEPSATCADHPASRLNAAIIGTSFSHFPTDVLIRKNCLSKLTLYYYMSVGEFGGPPYHELKHDLGDQDLARLRDSEILIVEENESYIARYLFIEKLHALLGL